jgi:hypothetical protein
MEAALQAPERRVPDMEDMWLYLHLVFETIWEYRFLYRDLDNILNRNKKLRTHFRRILERKVSTATAICKGFGGRRGDDRNRRGYCRAQPKHCSGGNLLAEFPERPCH